MPLYTWLEVGMWIPSSTPSGMWVPSSGFRSPVSDRNQVKPGEPEAHERNQNWKHEPFGTCRCSEQRPHIGRTAVPPCSQAESHSVAEYGSGVRGPHPLPRPRPHGGLACSHEATHATTCDLHGHKPIEGPQTLAPPSSTHQDG